MVCAPFWLGTPPRTKSWLSRSQRPGRRGLTRRHRRVAALTCELTISHRPSQLAGAVTVREVVDLSCRVPLRELGTTRHSERESASCGASMPCASAERKLAVKPLL